ncbi:MAG: MBL fold metallo-hydrolase [Chitinophagaceae bacterium]|nr:MBL fold metallo-hydrolase [Chitinophagaceae bacterium]
MLVEQMYTGCLAEAAYYIESNGEAAIIDPLRDIKPYIKKAEERGAVIKYIFETHFHADFVSGHLELSHKTGATIVFGPTAAPAYKAHIAEDHELFKLGDVYIKLLHTPGHTMESSCFLLIDENGKENSIFTGDTLFIGDVGRPDLVQKVKKEITPELLARKLYNSLHTQIMPLANEVIVYPGHGAGSACGKSMSKETIDTLGHQKATNYALNPALTEDEFVKQVTEGLVAPPQYFPTNVLMNVRGGILSIEEISKRGTTPLSITDFLTAQESLNALVLDTRSKEAYAHAHIPGSWFIGLDDQFAPWAGALITDMEQPILLITEPGREEEAVVRLARVGYDYTLGYLQGGMEAWTVAGKPIAGLEEITPESFAQSFESLPVGATVLDVRRNSEYEREHILGVQNFPLDFIHQNLSQLDPDKTYYVHCAGGYRSVIACSILLERGFKKVINIKGGFNKLKTTGLPLSAYKILHTEL